MRQIDYRMQRYLAELEGLLRGFLFQEREAMVSRRAALVRVFEASRQAKAFSLTRYGEIADCGGRCFVCDVIHGTCACGRSWIEANEAAHLAENAQAGAAYRKDLTAKACDAVKNYLQRKGALDHVGAIRLRDGLAWRGDVMERGRWAM